MLGLDNMKTRLEFEGGLKADDRMTYGKLQTLKKALLYSYQSQTIVLEDGRKFRCLITSEKTKPDYDRKIISIPYEDICLGNTKDEIKKHPQKKTSKGIELIGLKPGDTFRIEGTDIYWIVYLQHLEEKAYFKAEIYKCEETIEINNKDYHCYIRGPIETTIQWNQKKSVNWNKLNYSLIIYIKKNEETVAYFKRFQKVKIGGKTWQVATVDPYNADGVLEVNLDEWYENKIEENLMEKPKEDKFDYQMNRDVYIEGPKAVYPYETLTYKIKNLFNGEWFLDALPQHVTIEKLTDTEITIYIATGRSGNFNLVYKKDDIDIVLPIRIKSI